MSLPDNLRRLMERVENARQHTHQQVSLVAVSKHQPEESVRAAVEVGIRDFGENYVQELVRRRAQFPGVRWHLIGHLQTNKAKLAAQADLVHTIDSGRAAAALARHVGDRPQSILLQVNTSGAATKSGCAVDQAVDLAAELLAMPQLNLRGMMCVAEPGEPRVEFARLRALRDKAEQASGASLPELSMGMSSDFEDAIHEGATIIRVGTILFGPRSPAT